MNDHKFFVSSNHNGSLQPHNNTKYHEPGQNINAQVSISIYNLCREFHSKKMEALRLICANKFGPWELIIDGLRLNLQVRIS